MDELTPRQIEFLKHYSDPKSETFCNALGSALKSGYSQEYSENITHLMPDWLSEVKKRQLRTLRRAEKRGDELIDSEDERVAADMSKFFMKTLGKDEGYSERTELTGKGGERMMVVLANELADKYEIAPSTGGNSEG